MCLDFHSIAGMKKNVCILSSAYLPPIQYMSKLLLYDEVIIDAMEHYRKQSYRNRCQLYGANGILPLTVPLMHLNSENTAVRDMKIANDFDWQKVHWRSLESAYRCSPFFEYYEDYFMEFYSVEQQSLLHFNNSLLHKVCDLLRIKPNITHALEYVADYGEGADDFRNTIHFKEKFAKVDADFHPVRYIQVFENKHGFKPNLSILDLMFCEGPHALEILKSSCGKGE